MKSLLAAAAIALVPAFAAAGDMHAFDYKGNGNPVALAEAAVQPKPAQVAAQAVIPSPMFLTRDSNFSVFFKADIPASIQREALRVLWATHPEFTQVDLAASQALSYPTVLQNAVVAALQQ